MDTDNSLFKNDIHQPLADRMRPQNIRDIVGQHQLLDSGKPLRRIIDKKVPISLILWGPPGTGKSTLAFVMAKMYGLPFETYNASVDNKAHLQKLVNKHKNESFILQLDEIHRLTKPVQDFLLPYLESGQIILVGTTTENPIITINPAVRSRSEIFEFKPITTNDMVPILQKASKTAFCFELNKQLSTMIGNSSNGDVRIALNMLETLMAIHGEQLSSEDVAEYAKNQHFAFDKNATYHYDYLSAFNYAIIGSDTDAALYYLSVILNSSDLDSAIRRIRDAAYMCIGLADTKAVDTAVLACEVAEKIGLPRASTNLSYATIVLCLAPKSDSAWKSYESANEDGKKNNQSYPIPNYLRDSHYKHSKEITGGGTLIDPFNQPHQVAHQRYLPEKLKNREYYKPRNNINEKKYLIRYKALKKYLYGNNNE